ncbi:hypothetical protein Tco_0709009, partial [Tanacetum coccineum]
IMAASTIAIYSVSSNESVRSPPSRVILFGDIPTVIPSTSVVSRLQVFACRGLVKIRKRIDRKAAGMGSSSLGMITFEAVYIVRACPTKPVLETRVKRIIVVNHKRMRISYLIRCAIGWYVGIGYGGYGIFKWTEDYSFEVGEPKVMAIVIGDITFVWSMRDRLLDDVSRLFLQLIMTTFAQEELSLRENLNMLFVQELTMMCTKMVSEEEDRVEKFIGGLLDNIQGNVIAAEPTRLQDAIRIANHLMDKKLRAIVGKYILS